jgi:hypothetical protein
MNYVNLLWRQIIHANNKSWHGTQTWSNLTKALLKITLNNILLSASGSSKRVFSNRYLQSILYMLYFSPSFLKNGRLVVVYSISLSWHWQYRWNQTYVFQKYTPCKPKSSNMGASSLNGWSLAQFYQLLVHFVVALLCSFVGLQVQFHTVWLHRQPCWLSVRKTLNTKKNKCLQLKYFVYRMDVGTRQCSWLRHYASGRKIAGLIPDDVIGFFQLT